uniref:Uncharacterized protein n=1 Tax=Noctiluca scintillans TaxID=2966 RepID=A0A7S1AD35_NOCSC|mmetsp:Transcript_41363/g.109588  ORF Transcript_41363/g.109588 Transcript_41363/m.109588 type:complete len:133 (+) Transcript_41363:80-478(+)
MQTLILAISTFAHFFCDVDAAFLRAHATNITNSTGAVPSYDAPYSHDISVPQGQKVQATNVSEQVLTVAADADCQMSLWSEWSDCEDIAGDSLRTKFQFRQRHAITPQRGDGAPCGESSAQQACHILDPLIR